MIKTFNTGFFQQKAVTIIWLYRVLRYRGKSEELYEKIAPRYDTVFRPKANGRDYRAFFDLFYNNLNVEGAMVMDACIGTGLLAERLAPDAKIVAGFDRSFPQLEQLSRKKLPKIKYIQADIENIPFESNYFDVVTNCGCFGFLIYKYFDEEKAMAEMIRLLKPGGELGVWFKFALDRPRPLLQWIISKFGWKLYDASEIKAIFEKYGLTFLKSDELPRNGRRAHIGKIYFGKKA